MGPPLSIRLSPEEVEVLAKGYWLLKSCRQGSRAVSLQHSSQEIVENCISTEFPEVEIFFPLPLCSLDRDPGLKSLLIRAEEA